MAVASAHLDEVDLLGTVSRMGRARMCPLVIASVDASTPVLHGMDWIRIDAARDGLHRSGSVRDRYEEPAMLDVPGPATRREGSSLTTSEFLVYAAAEEYEWVNLRGVQSVHEIERAREFLPESTRLTVTASTPNALQRSIDELCEEGDAVVLGCHELERVLGRHRVRDALRVAVLGAATKGKPCFAASGLLRSMLRSSRPGPRDLDRVTTLAQDGCAGFILSAETLEGAHAQSCVDVVRLVAEHAPGSTPSPRTGTRRPAARVGGPATPAGSEHLLNDESEV
jgi:pyruvate kinase